MGTVVGVESGCTGGNIGNCGRFSLCPWAAFLSSCPGAARGQKGGPPATWKVRETWPSHSSAVAEVRALLCGGPELSLCLLGASDDGTAGRGEGWHACRLGP